MAGFRTHVGTSTALGAGYAGTLHTIYGVPMPTATVAGALCGFAGMLPDLDSDYGIPLREAMSFAAATIPVFLVNRFESLQLNRDTIIIIAIALYLFVRFGIGTMIRKFTVHRGMFHSIPAMLICGGLTYLLTGTSPTNERLMMSGGVMGGFFSHLLLDEIYAVEYKGGRWRTKKSFGTAMKLWGSDGWSNFSAYAKLAVVGMGIVGEPDMLKQFTNSPQMAGQIGQAIDIIAGMNKSQPQFAKQFDQLKNILGSLNMNSQQQGGGQWSGGQPSSGGWANATGAQNTGQSPGGAWNNIGGPQNGGAWQNPQQQQPNNQYNYAQPNNADPNQPPTYVSYPQQQQQQQMQPGDYQQQANQWPAANQSYNNDGQPAQYQQQYDTAQRSFGGPMQ